MAEISRIGVVLSSGGLRGVFAHTGFLMAIQKLGIQIVASAGCSAGALTGGVAASGTSLERWATVLKDVKGRSFWTPDSLPRVLWQVLARRGRGYTGLSSTHAAIQFCRENITAKTFEECRYPFYALAIDLANGRKTIFDKGELAPRMVASAAVPILYRPVEIDGAYFSDGALIDFAPTDAICCRHQLDVVIVHHVSQSLDRDEDIKKLFQRPWTMLEIVDRLMFRQRPWYLSGEPLSLRRCPCGCDAVIIAIEPELPTLVWPRTQSGVQIQKDAMEQAVALLGPHLDALTSNPRQGLPVQETSRRTQAAGCGSD